MAFDNNFIDELKMNVNIVDVVGRQVNLTKSGANYKGLCPFHSEKTPSFMVNEEKQIFNCFGCGEKGDVISFVQKYNRIPFMEAVETLCEEYGIRMPERISSGPKIDYDKYYDINAKAARFFYEKLTKGRNIGYAYFKSRHMDDDTIVKFGLGYAPESGTALVSHLRKEGVSDEDMLKLGLANNGKNGLYDRFRGRVVFPIFNTTGKVIGFGARILSDDIKPKYLNSAESEIFLKKNNLFALNLTKKDISDEDRVIVVEGYMDAISLYQNGVRNVAASLGTALTDNQAKLLTRYTKNIVLSYDSDAAGIKAALRGIDVIRKAGGKVRILRVKDAKDPDEYIKRFGREAFNRLVDEAVYATDFKLELARAGFDLNDSFEILEYIRKCVPILRELGPVEQDIYFRKLAEEFNISEHSIALEVRTDADVKMTSSHNEVYRERRASWGDDTDRYTKIEMSLVILSMFNTRYIKRIDDDAIIFKSKLSRGIFSILKNLNDGEENGMHRVELNDICRQLEPDEEKALRKYVNIIKLGPDDETFYKECCSVYELQKCKDMRMEILNRLAVAEQLGNADEINSIASELMKVNSRISKLSEEKNV